MKHSIYLIPIRKNRADYSHYKIKLLLYFNLTRGIEGLFLLGNYERNDEKAVILRLKDELCYTTIIESIE